MPRNADDGSAELRSLFVDVDHLRMERASRATLDAQNQVRTLVEEDGLQLTDFGRKTARSYENWRKAGRVPTVKRGHPATPLDLLYVAAFLDLIDDGWRASPGAVLHLFADGLEIPPSVVPQIAAAFPPFQLPAGAIEASGQLIEKVLTPAIIQGLRELAWGSETDDFPERASAYRARTTLRGLEIASIESDPESLTSFDLPEETYDDLSENVKELIGRIFANSAAIRGDESEIELDARWYPNPNWSYPDPRSLLKYLRVDTSEITDADLERNAAFVDRVISVIPRATSRILSDPQSIRQYLPLAREILGFASEEIPRFQLFFGPQSKGSNRKVIEIVDEMVVHLAAIARELQE